MTIVLWKKPEEELPQPGKTILLCITSPLSDGSKFIRIVIGSLGRMGWAVQSASGLGMSTLITRDTDVLAWAHKPKLPDFVE